MERRARVSNSRLTVSLSSIHRNLRVLVCIFYSRYYSCAGGVKTNQFLGGNSSYYRVSALGDDAAIVESLY